MINMEGDSELCFRTETCGVSSARSVAVAFPGGLNLECQKGLL
jgi:hypothetical protein